MNNTMPAQVYMSIHGISNLSPFYKKNYHSYCHCCCFLCLSGVEGMKHKCIHTVSCLRKGPGCYDTLFVSAASGNAEDSPTYGTLNFEVAHGHLFFSYTLDKVKCPCTLVHWFSCATDRPNDITSTYPNGQPATTFVHLDTIFKEVHLIPVFPNHPAPSKHQCHEETFAFFKVLCQ